MGDRPLELVQIEESPAFRTNVGFVELTGNPATIEISAGIPGQLSTQVLTLNLKPFEFAQLNRLMKQFYAGYTYNGSLTIRVIGGTGRVTAYASVVDNRTQDPTYVPAN